MNMMTTRIMIVAVQNNGEGDNLILDTHPSRSSPPPELSPSSIISCTEETYEGHQDVLPLQPQSSITAEISKKSQSDQEAHVSGLDIGPPPSLFVPIIPMTTIEIGDTSEEFIDFSAAGTSGASSSCAGFSGAVNSGVRKHSLDPVVDDIVSTSEEDDDDVATEFVRKWSRVDSRRGNRGANVRRGRQQNPVCGGKACILS